jgi:hypothetical protein
VKLVCLIATWRDEALLARAVKSAAPFVDIVVVLDGGYVGVVSAEEAWTPETDLLTVYNASENVQIVQIEGLYPSEIAKRNALLSAGRFFALDDPEDPVETYWALVLDADEVLVNGDQLNEFIAICRQQEQAPGLQRIEPDGDSYWAPSRLFVVTPSTEYGPKSFLLQSEEYGQTFIDHRHFPSAPGENAHLLHRWNDRSAWRLRRRLLHDNLVAKQDAAATAQTDGDR